MFCFQWKVLCQSVKLAVGSMVNDNGWQKIYDMLQEFHPKFAMINS